jgi:aerobic carbon-monoxide dehydrogenase large subunit
MPTLAADRDVRLATGQGRYLADLQLGSALEVAFVRSPFAHARIRTIRGPGATAGSLDLADLTMDGPVGPRNPAQAWPALARDRVRFVGQAVAAVWAEDRYAAEDLAEQVIVDWEPLPAEPPQVCFEHEITAGTSRELPGDHVFESEFQVCRQAPLPMETRGVLASWDAASGKLTVWTSTQVPDIVRRGLASALRLDEAAVRVLVPDVGGGFGLKAHVFPEDIVVAALARRLGRPVRWVEDRSENLLAGVHAHDNRVRLRVAVTEDGRLRTVDAEIVSDVGAYSVYPFSASLEPMTAASAIFAPYALEALRIRASAVTSHRCPVGATRGVGTNTAVYVTERAMDEIARQLGLDPYEFRRRNVLRRLPCVTLSGRQLDSGDYAALLDRLAEKGGYTELRRWQEAARERGLLVGIGLGLFNEHSGTGRSEYRRRGLTEVPGVDACTVRVHENGRVSVSTSGVEIGQGVAETCRAVASCELGIGPDRIEIVMGDTGACPPGTGAFVSRSAVGLVDSLVGACREVVERDLEPGTVVTRTVEPQQVFPSGAHLAVVEVDRDTFKVRVVRYLAVEDCGTILDAIAVDGQLRGGVAMGIGKVLLEQAVYTEDGQPRSTSLMDYLLPLATDVPPIDLEHVASPSPRTLLGSKGVGEAGTVGALGAVANAVADAVAGSEATLRSLPYSPVRLFEAVRTAQARPTN